MDQPLAAKSNGMISQHLEKTHPFLQTRFIEITDFNLFIYFFKLMFLL